MDFLIAGLGNPGAEYERTPHNLGFMVIDGLSARHSIRVTRKENMALVGLGAIAGKEVALAKPQTYMNLSGPSLKALLERYELAAERLVVVYDELDLPWMTLRIRPKGSSAGHKGMESVIRSLGTNEIVRVRLGIHPGHRITGGAEFVLGRFRRGQEKEMQETVATAVEAVETIIAEGVEKSMAMFNRRAQGSTQEEG